MRVGFISDIHGNLRALDAVLAALERTGVEELVCLGDVAVGPQPAETLARVRELDCPVIMGNWDAAFVTQTMPPTTDPLGRRLNEIHGWWAAQLSDDDREFMRGFLPRLELRPDGVAVLCYHGSPRSYDDWVLATTPDDELAPLFAGCDEALLVGGHTHLQMARRFRRSLIVNPGSVGLPFQDWWPKEVRIAPWAEYGVVEVDQEHLAVDLKRAPFDVEALLHMSRRSGMPHADWWASCWSLD